MPEGTLKATADHGTAADVLRRDGGDSAATLAEFEKAGIGISALAEKLQTEGADAFVQSWRELLRAIETKSAALRAGATAGR
jgi:transaldolase